MGVEPVPHKGCCLWAVMAGERGRNPILGEEDVTGALDLLHLIERRHDVSQRFLLPERMVGLEYRILLTYTISPTLPSLKRTRLPI